MENWIMMANGDMYYFQWGNHESNLSMLMEQYNLSYTGSNGYGLINEHEICAEHDIICCHGNDTSTVRYGEGGLTEAQIDSLWLQVALGKLDNHFVMLLVERCEEDY